MEKGNEPINPCHIKGRQGFANMPTIPNREVYGLTKREYFAGLAMQSIIAKGGTSERSITYNAVRFADDLLEELERLKK